MSHLGGLTKSQRSRRADRRTMTTTPGDGDGVPPKLDASPPLSPVPHRMGKCRYPRSKRRAKHSVGGVPRCRSGCGTRNLDAAESHFDLGQRPPIAVRPFVGWTWRTSEAWTGLGSRASSEVDGLRRESTAERAGLAPTIRRTRITHGARASEPCAFRLRRVRITEGDDYDSCCACCACQDPRTTRGQVRAPQPLGPPHSLVRRTDNLTPHASLPAILSPDFLSGTGSGHHLASVTPVQLARLSSNHRLCGCGRLHPASIPVITPVITAPSQSNCSFNVRLREYSPTAGTRQPTYRHHATSHTTTIGPPLAGTFPAEGRFRLRKTCIVLSAREHFQSCPVMPQIPPGFAGNLAVHGPEYMTGASPALSSGSQGSRGT